VRKTPIELSARVKVKGHNEDLSNIDARAHDTQFGQQQTIVSKERFPSRYQKQNHFISFHPAMQRGRE
jgi:hypothetical protein